MLETCAIWECWTLREDEEVHEQEYRFTSSPFDGNKSIKHEADSTELSKASFTLSEF